MPVQARKRFGQHFLHDQHVIDRIISVIAPSINQHLVEIGPGLGALTIPLLKLLPQLDVIEIDYDLGPNLKKKCEGLGQLNFYQSDALKFDFSALASGVNELRIIGNLPYNISTPLMFHLLSFSSYIKDMHFMLQKEVVDRMVAKPNTKAYGRLSVMLQYHCEIESLFAVGAHAFNPPPKVNSSIVRLIPYRVSPYDAVNTKVLSLVTRTAFSMRRKVISNALKKLISQDALCAAGINPNSRPEQLSVEDYIKITHYME